MFYQSGITPYRASIEAGCGYEYALVKFTEWGQKLSEDSEKDWIQRNESSRKRSLEGLSLEIIEANKMVELAKDEVERAKKLRSMLQPKMMDSLKNSPLAQILKEMDEESFESLITALRSYLKDEISFSLLVAQQIQQYRLNKIYSSELKQQYEIIEIMPPPQAVIEAIIEKNLAEKLKVSQVALPNAK